MRTVFFSLIYLLFLLGCSTNDGVTTVVPAAPTNLTGTAISGTQINLSWTDDATNEVGYKVQRKTASGSYSVVGSTGTDISTFSDLGLTNNTTYNYRVYAYNAAGNSLQYSNEISITTANGGGGNSVTDIDGNIYPTVQICNQVWTAKNLDVATYRNGDPISKVTDPAIWAALRTGAYCYYNNDSANYAPIYGKLYNWYAVNDPRGIAPTGYHVPSDAEWTTMVSCLGGEATGGGKLKEAGLSHWAVPNLGATNSSGFTGLPGGFRSEFGSFGSFSFNGGFWSSTEDPTTNARYRYLYSSYNNVYRGTYSKAYGFSVRCVKD